MNRLSNLLRSARVLVCLGVLLGAFVSRADTLDWKKDHVDASIESWNLNTLLEKIATATGWQVYVEPGTKTSISVKFKNQTADEALRRMLKNVNYARKETIGTSQLFVYRTDAHAATELVKSKPTTEKKTGRILNELIVQLKKGSKMTIEELAAKLHAKILGRDDDLHLYRLGFEDETAATAARVTMAGTADVGAVDSNYSYANPAPNQMIETANGGTLTPKVMPDGQRFVGLLDTAVNVDSTYAPYMLPPVDVTGQGSPPADSLTHGTAMMETLLEPSAEHPSKIQSYNVYGPGETTTSFELTEGLIKAVKAGANPINISSGGPGESEVLHEAIKQATSQGVVIVAAAGNQPVATPTYPAAWPEVIGVTAGSSSGQYEIYANRGRFIDMMAPGTSYISAGGQTWMVQGTSVSTAFVTGQIVNYMNQYHINPAQAWQRMSASPPAGYIRMR
jgi:thermitase